MIFLKEILGEEEIPEEQTIPKEVIAVTLNRGAFAPQGTFGMCGDSFGCLSVTVGGERRCWHLAGRAQGCC